MQKEIVQGVPFWKDKNNNLFSYETDKKNFIHLGSFNQETQTFTLKDSWQADYKAKLEEYRFLLKNRERKENKTK